MMLLKQAQQAVVNAQAGHSKGGVIRWFLRFGILGLFFICVVDSSPIPLPIPGSSDLLVILFAAQRKAWLLLTVVATLGSIVGAAASYHTGRIGGIALIDHYAPRRLRERMKNWAECHALLSVALPAILPPPAPLMPFLIAAGAMKMPKRKFYISFTISRFVRHAFFAWLGVHYGPHIMHFYNRFVDQYGWILLVIIWGSVIFAAIYGIGQFRKGKKTRSAMPQTATA